MFLDLAILGFLGLSFGLVGSCSGYAAGFVIRVFQGFATFAMTGSAAISFSDPIYFTTACIGGGLGVCSAIVGCTKGLF